jgi:hypothetical protein
MFRNFII